MVALQLPVLLIVAGVVLLAVATRRAIVKTSRYVPTNGGGHAAATRDWLVQRLKDRYVRGEVTREGYEAEVADVLRGGHSRDSRLLLTPSPRPYARLLGTGVLAAGGAMLLGAGLWLSLSPWRLPATPPSAPRSLVGHVVPPPAPPPAPTLAPSPVR